MCVWWDRSDDQATVQEHLDGSIVISKSVTVNVCDGVSVTTVECLAGIKLTSQLNFYQFNGACGGGSASD